ncbi:MAG TPA: hypothetical protein VGO86_06965 [Candidatus Dormibacteraeota bacterium]
MTDRTAPHLLTALAVTLLLAGCGSVATSAPSATAATPSTAVTPSTTPTPVLSASPGPVVTQPAGVAAVVGSTVTAGNPRLLPAHLPAGMSATVRASQATYTVTYTDDLHTREIDLAVAAGGNPPPYVGNGSTTYIQFRGARTSYVVYDTTAPMSKRYLLWLEPGAWSRMPSESPQPGIEYFLVASGLTEPEFFQVANSLQPVG